MDHAVTLKQVLSLLSGAAQDLHVVFHTALQLWLRLQEAPQQHKQDLQAEAAVQAVQAALHAASMCATDDLKLAWMKLHVPSVSMAVTMYVVAQSDIRLKRVSILQQLLAGQGEAPCQKVTASSKDETNLYWQLYAASRVALFLAPLSTVMKALSENWNTASSSNLSTQQQQRKCSYKQRDRLLAHMTSELVAEHARIISPLESLEQLLRDTMGVTLCWRSQNKEFSRLLINALITHLQASVVWLWVALSIPPTDKHHVSKAWLTIVDWEALMYLASRSDVHTAYCGELLCSVLARPDLHRHLHESRRLPSISYLLYAYGVQPKQLREAGVSQAVIQQLPPVSQAAQQALDDHFTCLKERLRWVGREEVHATDGSSSCAEVAAVDHDSSLDEMQALVLLMYGKLDVKE